MPKWLFLFTHYGIFFNLILTRKKIWPNFWPKLQGGGWGNVTLNIKKIVPSPRPKQIQRRTMFVQSDRDPSTANRLAGTPKAYRRRPKKSQICELNVAIQDSIQDIPNWLLDIANLIYFPERAIFWFSYLFLTYHSRIYSVHSKFFFPQQTLGKVHQVWTPGENM